MEITKLVNEYMRNILMLRRNKSVNEIIARQEEIKNLLKANDKLIEDLINF